MRVICVCFFDRVLKQHISNNHGGRTGQASPVSNRTGGFEMDITGIAKSHHAGTPKASSQKEWKLSDSLREKITGCGAGHLYGK